MIIWRRSGAVDWLRIPGLNHSSAERQPKCTTSEPLPPSLSRILLPPTAPQQGLEVSVPGLNHPQRHLRPAVVQNALQMIQQHPGQLLEGFQPLPTKLIDPTL